MFGRWHCPFRARSKHSNNRINICMSTHTQTHRQTDRYKHMHTHWLAHKNTHTHAYTLSKPACRHWHGPAFMYAVACYKY